MMTKGEINECKSEWQQNFKTQTLLMEDEMMKPKISIRIEEAMTSTIRGI